MSVSDERKPTVPLSAIGAASAFGGAMAYRDASKYGGDVLLAVVCGATAGAIIEWATPRIDAATAALMALAGFATYTVAAVSKSG